MSVRLTVSTRNLRGLVANFSAADVRAQKAIRRTVATYGERQWRLARELAPVSATPVKRGDHIHEPGFLRSRIRLRFSDDGLVYEVGWREQDFTEKGEPFYPLFTEFGTRFMAARPCVFPARDQVYPEFRSALGKEVRAAVKRRTA